MSVGHRRCCLQLPHTGPSRLMSLISPSFILSLAAHLIAEACLPQLPQVVIVEVGQGLLQGCYCSVPGCLRRQGCCCTRSNTRCLQDWQKGRRPHMVPVTGPVHFGIETPQLNPTVKCRTSKTGSGGSSQQRHMSLHVHKHGLLKVPTKQHNPPAGDSYWSWGAAVA